MIPTAPPYRDHRYGVEVKILESCCGALASILKASGLQHAAAEAKCLQALGRALNHMERHGLAAIKQITYKNDEMRRKALEAGIKDEWLPKEELSRSDKDALAEKHAQETAMREAQISEGPTATAATPK